MVGFPSPLRCLSVQSFHCLIERTVGVETRIEAAFSVTPHRPVTAVSTVNAAVWTEETSCSQIIL